MNTSLKTLLATCALMTAATAATAAPIISISGNGSLVGAQTAETTFLSYLVGPSVVENFDGMGTAPTPTGTTNNSWENKSTLGKFTTAVGTFQLNSPGQYLGNAENTQLLIESTRTGEDGREILASNAKDFWLDSNDAKVVTWTLGAPLTGAFNAFGFYLADPSDQGAKLTLYYTDGTSWTSDNVLPGKANASVYYVSVVSEKSVVGGQFIFNNNGNNHDGWGIDDIVVGHVSVPEPSTLILMGLGLLGLGAARRRTAA